MAAPRRKPDPPKPDLTAQSDFQLLNALTALVSKERSQHLTEISWEIMRRYTASLVNHPPASPRDYTAILGEARWGDAKRVETIFGIKRGVASSLVDKGHIRGKVLGEDEHCSNGSTKKKSKRIYDLISILEHLESPANEGEAS